MLLFSRHSSGHGSQNGFSRDPPSNRHSRNSCYESAVVQSPRIHNAKPVVSPEKSVQATQGDESPTLLKRTSNRSTLKKSRPHSWHSTLQKGFQRARSRSSGRGERNRAAAAAASSSTPGSQKHGNKEMIIFLNILLDPVIYFSKKLIKVTFQVLR
jgi:hypothetical protein